MEPPRGPQVRPPEPGAVPVCQCLCHAHQFGNTSANGGGSTSAWPLSPDGGKKGFISPPRAKKYWVLQTVR